MAAMIGRNKKRCIEGMRDLECGTRPPCAFRAAISGKTFAPGLEEPPMFKMPAYDPVGIAILGFGVLAVVIRLLPFSWSQARTICKVCVARVPLCCSQWTSGVRLACARA